MAAAAVAPASLTRPGVQVPFPESTRQRMVEGANVPTVSAYVRPTKLTGKHSAKKIRFGFMADPRLRFKRPLSVVISRENNAFIANSRDLQEFGCGETISESLDDLSKSIAELYFELQSQADRLGDDLTALFIKLGTYIEERPRG